MSEHSTGSPQGDQLDVVKAWQAHSQALAEWAEHSLIVRDDAYGAHYIDPAGDVRRSLIKEAPGRPQLSRHFSADSGEDVIGLLVMAQDETCRWVVVDIDAHAGDGANATVNLEYAHRVHARARDGGLDVRLLDSNGQGGYHLWVVFDRPVPGAEAWRLGKWLVHDSADFGFDRAPETFAKSPCLNGKRFGGWVRLPGRHHKRPHWSSVWSPRHRLWAVGQAAVDSLLKFTGNNVHPATLIPGNFTGFAPHRESTKGVFVEPAPDSKEHRVKPAPDSNEHRSELNLAYSALQHLGDDFYDDHDHWITIGMCLRQLGEDGLVLWDDWSSRSDNKYDPAEVAARWVSFTPGSDCGGVSLGSLFKHAREAGWPGPKGGGNPNIACRLHRKPDTYLIPYTHRMRKLEGHAR